MKLAISNIAWKLEETSMVYELMEEYGYTGLEIAPTKIIPEAPYDYLDRAIRWRENLNKEIVIPSIQSIWYGRKENIFGSDEERNKLKEYMKKAILFAEAIKCTNLVMGCPKNRNVPDNVDSWAIAVPFFKELGEFAKEHNTVIGLEANPEIYGTNFINDTLSAVELIKSVDSTGFRLNLDLGTIIQNKENMIGINEYADYISHVHISEPGLEEIKERKIHVELRRLLEKADYVGYVSVEMAEGNNVKGVMQYVKNVFG